VARHSIFATKMFVWGALSYLRQMPPFQPSPEAGKEEILFAPVFRGEYKRGAESFEFAANDSRERRIHL
jgi:hypothetical protein